MARLELDQHVHVAGRREGLTQHGSEERQPLDVMAPAEVGEDPSVDGDLDGHGWIVADSGLSVAPQQSRYRREADVPPDIGSVVNLSTGLDWKRSRGTAGSRPRQARSLDRPQAGRKCSGKASWVEHTPRS